MNGCLAQIWRHPIKSHGRETLQSVGLSAGKSLPFDRHWAIIHERHKFDRAEPEWVPCGNFARGAKNPEIMAISARLDEQARRITLSHPRRPDLTCCPDDPADQQKFLNWAAPLERPDSLVPRGIVSVPGRGMTDTDYPSVSINSLSSLTALETAAGTPVDANRFRGNLWIKDMEPWAEFDLIGKEIMIGSAILKVTEPIGRCKATEANPMTGQRDLETLAILRQNWGHQDFGVYAQVIKGGDLTIGDPARKVT